MTHVPRVELPADGKLVFQPDGYHLMLVHPKRVLRTGDRIRIELRFADGSRVPVQFQVREETAVQENAGPPHGGH